MEEAYSYFLITCREFPELFISGYMQRFLACQISFVLVLLSMPVPAAPGQTKAGCIHELMAHYHSLGRHHGAVLVAPGREMIYEGGSGLADVRRDISTDHELKSDFDSVTKYLAGLPVMQRIGRGAICPDVPAATYLPSFPVPIDEQITIAHLLTNQSGIADLANDIGAEEFEARYLHRRQPSGSVIANMLRRPKKTCQNN